MGGWCPLDDWNPKLTDEVWAVYLPGECLPLHWTGSGPRTVTPGAAIASTWAQVATVVHWAREHPDQLRALIGEYELFPGMTRPHELSSTL